MGHLFEVRHNPAKDFNKTHVCFVSTNHVKSCDWEILQLTIANRLSHHCIFHTMWFYVSRFNWKNTKQQDSYLLGLLTKMLPKMFLCKLGPQQMNGKARTQDSAHNYIFCRRVLYGMFSTQRSNFCWAKLILIWGSPQSCKGFQQSTRVFVSTNHVIERFNK